MPTRSKTVWTFNSGDTFTGNPKWLFVYVTRFRPDITAYWLCETEATARYVRGLGYQAVTFTDSKAASIMARTGVYVVNQVKEVIPEELRGSVFLNLWHGVGIKGVERAMNKGYLEERIAKKYIRHNRLYRNNQLFLCTSETMEANFRRQLGLDEPSVIRGGYPQNLYPKEIGGYSSFDHDVLRRRGLPAHTRIALYAATPRRTATPDFLRQAFPDMERLVQRLEETDTLLILKMHPHMTKDRYFAQLKESFGSNPNLMFWDNTEDIYEIFPKIDLAVMDYSSIMYDLMAAGVTDFIRYIFDYDDGNEVVADGFDYLSLSCGTIAGDFDALIDALGQDNRVPQERLAELDEIFWGYSSADSLGHIVDRALAYEVRDIALPTLHTFDVFDTVIHRRGVTPGSVFQYVKQRMQVSDLGFGEYVVSRYPEIRQQAERSERDRRRRRPELVAEGLLEITYDEIHDRIADVYGLDERQSAALREWEIEGELASVIPDRKMIERVERLQAEGSPVLLISDMYLPREVVVRLLEKADPRLAALPLYLSSDTREQKATKTLYLKLYREIGYDFAEWIHHGDAPHGDVKQARAMGITVDQIPRTKFPSFEAEVMRDIVTWDGHLYAGMLRDFNRERRRSPQEAFAFNHVAAYLVPYVNWALDDALRRGYRTLYFVSRDGHHLKRIADALIDERGLELRTHYIYGSRTVWRLASQIDELDEDLFEPHGDFFNVRSLRALLGSARMNKEQFSVMFPEFSALTDSDLQNKETRAAVLAALSASPRFREHLLAAAARERAIAVHYLRQEIDLDEPFALVEYWGSGYTQTCLARLMIEAAGREIDTPVYYSRAVRPTEGHAVRHRFTSATYSMLFVEAVFANLDHSTVLSYREVNGTVRPMIMSRDHNAPLHNALTTWLPEHARRYARLPALDPDRLNRDVFRSGFNYYTRHPKSPVFIRNLAPLQDAVGIGAEEEEFAPGMSRAALKLHLAGESFHGRTRSMPMSLARSSEWVRVNYNLATEPKGRTPTWKKGALLGRAFVRTGYRRVVKQVRS